MIYIAVMGYGVVGSGVVEVLDKNAKAICGRAGKEIKVKYILDIRDCPDSPHKDKFIKDFNIILNDPDVKIVVEAIGGLNPAYNYVKQCLLSGKSVVTSNKELIAEKGVELLSIAKDKKLNLFFEASVGGGIPIIRPLHQCLAANRVNEIAGILNGTTNFILSKMAKEQMPFEQALEIAQSLGYAEKDPTADIQGFDSSRKICILASLAFGRHVYPKQVYTKGISDITLQDIEYAASFNSVIKLIASAKLTGDNRLIVMVSPMLVSRDSQLGGVEDVFNAIIVRGDAIGDVMFYGKGAGKFPTASAVVADVIDCVKHIESNKPIYWQEGSGDYVVDHSEALHRMYCYVKADNSGKAIELIREKFGQIQLLTRPGEPKQDIAFVTKEMTLKDANKMLADLECKGIKLVNSLPVANI